MILEDTMLRNLSQEGAEKLFQLYSSGEYQKYFRHFDDFLNKEQLLQQAISGGNPMEIVDNNQIVGFVQVRVENKSRVAHLGTILDKAHQGKSRALLAVLETADYLFNKGILRIVCVCCRDDERTMKLLQKGGFLPEARMRGNCYCDGRIRDELRWVMPREVFYKTYKGR